MKFQQSVFPLSHPEHGFFPVRTDFRKGFLEIAVSQGQVSNNGSPFFVDFIETGYLRGQTVQAFIVPADKDFLTAFLNKGDMDVDDAFLADPVQPPDPLFQQFRVQRQVPKNEMIHELEIPSLAAYFGAQKDGGPFLS
jgi:hypothetical protein